MLNEKLLNETLQAIATGYAESHTRLWPLKSLYLSEHRRKYIVGDQVVIESGKLVNNLDEVPTHEITLLEGTLSDNAHQITVRNLSNNESQIIKL